MPQHDFSQLRDFNNKAAQYLGSMCQFNTKMKLETFQQFALTGLDWGIYLKLETFLIASNTVRDEWLWPAWLGLEKPCVM